jgi:flagellar hook-associated protein 3 FlgL
MTRVAENGLARAIVSDIRKARSDVATYSNQVSSGYKVVTPGDSEVAGTISGFRDSIARIEGYKTRIATVQSSLTFQDDVLKQVDGLITRAREVATQAANEPNSSLTRLSMANEVFALRDQLVVLANSRDSNGYIFGGADNDDPPYDRVGDYTSPSSGLAAVRYRFDNEAGTQQQRSTAVTDDISISVNTPGDQLFDNALFALERMGRALAGFRTTVDGNGMPDGTGAAFNFPNDFGEQTGVLQSALNDLVSASRDNILPERVSLGARLSRLEAAESIIDVNKANAEELLGKLQNADSVEAISNLTLAQNTLEASLQVTVRVLRQSILDYL